MRFLVVATVAFAFSWYIIPRSSADLTPIRQQEIHCNCGSKANRTWPWISANETLSYCCWQWLFLDCWELATCQSCGEDATCPSMRGQIEEIDRKRKELKTGLCKNVPEGSIKCGWPEWFWPIVFDVSCLSVAGLYLAVVYWKRHNDKTRSLK